MTMKIAAGIVEYADSRSLDRCLRSLNLGQGSGGGGGIDSAIIIHGRYSHNPIIPMPCMTRDTTLIAQSSTFPAGTVMLKRIYQPIAEIDARNLYLQFAAAQGCDWLLVIDSDEYVAPNADWSLFRKQLEFVQSLGLSHQVFDVIFEGTNAERGPRPRLFYRPRSVRYWKKHYWWVLEEKQLLLKGLSDAGRIIEGIFILEDKSLREPRYEQTITAYKAWQQENEH